MAGTTGRQRRSRKSGANTLIEYIIVLAVAFGLVFGVIRPFVVAAYKIPSASMVPTLMVGDRVLANKFLYHFEDPKRGQIAVFQSPEGGPDPLIKRVIGTPGDTIRLRRGNVFINGKRLKEPYVKGDPCNRALPLTCSFGPVTVPKGDYFMMGDNRTNSRDSRFFGPVPEKNFLGEAFVRFWPPDRIGAI